MQPAIAPPRVVHPRLVRREQVLDGASPGHVEAADVVLGDVDQRAATLHTAAGGVPPILADVVAGGDVELVGVTLHHALDAHHRLAAGDGDDLGGTAVRPAAAALPPGFVHAGLGGRVDEFGAIAGGHLGDVHGVGQGGNGGAVDAAAGVGPAHLVDVGRRGHEDLVGARRRCALDDAQSTVDVPQAVRVADPGTGAPPDLVRAIVGQDVEPVGDGAAFDLLVGHHPLGVRQVDDLGRVTDATAADLPPDLVDAARRGDVQVLGDAVVFGNLVEIDDGFPGRSVEDRVGVDTVAAAVPETFRHPRRRGGVDLIGRVRRGVRLLEADGVVVRRRRGWQILEVDEPLRPEPTVRRDDHPSERTVAVRVVRDDDGPVRVLVLDERHVPAAAVPARVAPPRDGALSGRLVGGDAVVVGVVVPVGGVAERIVRSRRPVHRLRCEGRVVGTVVTSEGAPVTGAAVSAVAVIGVVHVGAAAVAAARTERGVREGRFRHAGDNPRRNHHAGEHVQCPSGKSIHRFALRER